MLNANRRLCEPPPPGAVLSCLLQCHVSVDACQGGIQDLQLWTVSALPDLLADLFVQTGNKAGAFQHVKIMDQCGGIAGILKLSDHFLIRHDLA